MLGQHFRGGEVMGGTGGANGNNTLSLAEQVRQNAS